MSLFRPWQGVVVSDSSSSPLVEVKDHDDSSSQSSSLSASDSRSSGSAQMTPTTPMTASTVGSVFDFDGNCESPSVTITKTTGASSIATLTATMNSMSTMAKENKMMAELAASFFRAGCSPPTSASSSPASSTSYSYYYNYYYNQLVYYASLYSGQQQQQQSPQGLTSRKKMAEPIGSGRPRSQEAIPAVTNTTSLSSSLSKTLPPPPHRSIKFPSSVTTATTTTEKTSKRQQQLPANFLPFSLGTSPVFPTSLTAPPSSSASVLEGAIHSGPSEDSTAALKKISSMMDLQSLLTFQNLFFDSIGGGGTNSKKRAGGAGGGSSSGSCGRLGLGANMGTTINPTTAEQRPKKFVCVECKSAFSNRSQLNSHIRTHTGERPFVCDYKSCLKSFTRNEELTRHRRIHSGIRPYPCRWCDKRFGRKDHLRKHERTHERRLRSTILLNYTAGLPGFFPIGAPADIVADPLGIGSSSATLRNAGLPASASLSSVSDSMVLNGRNGGMHQERNH